jgi:hypothetical protein
MPKLSTRTSSINLRKQSFDGIKCMEDYMVFDVSCSAKRLSVLEYSRSDKLSDLLTELRSSNEPDDLLRDPPFQASEVFVFVDGPD